MNETRIMITFKGERAADALSIFYGWYLDGGGDEGFHASLEDHSLSMGADEYSKDESSASIVHNITEE